MSELIRLSLLLLLLQTAGCSSLRPVQAPADMVLLNPSRGPAPVLLTQRVTLDGWGQQRQFIAICRFTYEQARLVALLPTGQQLLYLEFDGEQLEQRTMPSIELPGKDILALIQFALWPAEVLHSSYVSENGWKVAITDNRRQLIYRDSVLLDVIYDRQQISIENHRAGYQVRIETLESKDLVF